MNGRGMATDGAARAPRHALDRIRTPTYTAAVTTGTHPQPEPTHVQDDAADIEPMESLLRRHGISPTRPRRQIAALMLSAPSHHSAEQVMERLAGAGVAVSKATVYNTLGLFARRGLLREVVVDRSKVFYDSNTSTHHHGRSVAGTA